MARMALPRLQCSCRQLVPVTRAHRVRAHALIPGGQQRCPDSGREVEVGAMVLPPSPAIVTTIRRRSAAELARWCGPRTWEDAGI
jgi:hypothetical protein